LINLCNVIQITSPKSITEESIYKKTALLFYYLKGYLGETLFDQCMHNYFEKWKFKHPQPEDIQAVFEETTKQNLDWFFNEFNWNNQED